MHRTARGEAGVDHSSIHKQTYIQQLLSGRKRVLVTSAAAQRSLPFDHSAERFQHSCGDAEDEFVARMLSDLRALEAKRKMTGKKGKQGRPK